MWVNLYTRSSIRVLAYAAATTTSFQIRFHLFHISNGSGNLLFPRRTISQPYTQDIWVNWKCFFWILNSFHHWYAVFIFPALAVRPLFVEISNHILGCFFKPAVPVAKLWFVCPTSPGEIASTSAAILCLYCPNMVSAGLNGTTILKSYTIHRLPEDFGFIQYSCRFSIN